MSVSRIWCPEILFHVDYSYEEIEYVATSFSPTRTDLAVNSLTPKSVPAGAKKILFGRYVLNIYES